MAPDYKALALRFPKFFISSLGGTLVDMGVLFVLSEFVFDRYFGVYILAPFISFECAVLTNFIFSFFFVWKDRLRGQSVVYFIRKYLVYNASATGTFIVKLGILLLFEVVFGWHVVFCNLAALCISGLLNFSMGEWIVFRKK